MRFAMRKFRRQPVFAFTVVTTLALAIGANIAVFSVVHAVLFRALPFNAPERLVWITSVRTDNPAAPFSLPEFMDYRGQTQTLSIAAYANWRAGLTGENINEGLQGARMSANAFEVLGVSAAAGRLLQESDDHPDAPKVAVLSYRLWQREFGGAVSIVGRKIRLNGESFAVVGILPPQFPLPLRDIDVVVPLVPDLDPFRHARNSTNFLLLFGRLNAGMSSEQAQAELTTICRSLRLQFPAEYARKDSVRAIPLKEALIGDYRPVMLLLFGSVLVVLGSALANLVSIVLVRANERRTELAVRVAIGASYRHLVRQLSAESFLLSFIGGSVGWMLSILAISAVLPWVPSSIPRTGEVRITGVGLAFAGLVALFASALMTFAPLVVIGRANRGEVLRAASRGTGDRRNGRVRQILVIGEISAAFLLVLTTTILLQNVLRLQNEQLGLSPDSVFQARISIPPTYNSPDDLARFYDRLSERLVRLPGVERVGVVSVAPLSGLLRTVPFAVEGESRSDRDQKGANLRIVSPGYMPTVGTRLLKGRLILETDRSDTPPVALVSSALAERFLRKDALAKRLLINDSTNGLRPVEIVGVVENVHQSALDVPPSFDIYLPLRQTHPESVALLRNNQFWMIKTATPPAAFRSSFVANLRAVDADAAVSSAATMRDYVEASLGPRRFNLGLFAGFSLSGVLLAVSGLYGLVSYTVSQRQREIGLRMAVGATQGNIRRMVLRQATLLGLVGLVSGICLALGAQPQASRLVQDVSIPICPVIAVTGLLLILIIFAAWLPARRATRISPTLALRGD
jgi:predicted permease